MSLHCVLRVPKKRFCSESFTPKSHLSWILHPFVDFIPRVNEQYLPTHTQPNARPWWETNNQRPNCVRSFIVADHRSFTLYMELCDLFSCQWLVLTINHYSLHPPTMISTAFDECNNCTCVEPGVTQAQRSPILILTRGRWRGPGRYTTVAAVSYLIPLLSSAFGDLAPHGDFEVPARAELAPPTAWSKQSTRPDAPPGINSTAYCPKFAIYQAVLLHRLVLTLAHGGKYATPTWPQQMHHAYAYARIWIYSVVHVNRIRIRRIFC